MGKGLTADARYSEGLDTYLERYRTYLEKWGRFVAGELAPEELDEPLSRYCAAFREYLHIETFLVEHYLPCDRAVKRKVLEQIDVLVQSLQDFHLALIQVLRRPYGPA
jgi:hypothetical protein